MLTYLPRDVQISILIKADPLDRCNLCCVNKSMYMHRDLVRDSLKSLFPKLMKECKELASAPVPSRLDSEYRDYQASIAYVAIINYLLSRAWCNDTLYMCLTVILNTWDGKTVYRGNFCYAYLHCLEVDIRDKFYSRPRLDLMSAIHKENFMMGGPEISISEFIRSHALLRRYIQPTIIG